MKKTFLEIIKETSIVVIGILIALFINNWNDNRKDEKYYEQILESIKLELNQSKEDIAYNIPKQQILIDSLKHYATDNETSLQQVFSKVDGVHAPIIKTNSWIAISNTKIELINFNRITILNNIDEGKELLKEKLNYLMNFSYANLNDTTKEKKEQVMYLLLDVVSTENSIKLDIESFE